MAVIALSRLGYQCTLEDKAMQDRVLAPMRPDVFARLKVRGGRKHRWPVVYVEVQSIVSSEWKEKIKKNYEGLHVIIIELPRLDMHFPGCPTASEAIEMVYTRIEQQIDNDTLMPEKDIKHIDRKGYKRRKAEEAAVKEMSK
jgi:coenzyme F420-reducing hydrogenase gamma subunit